MNFFGQKLREARESAGHTQASMAEALGMIRTGYLSYETGKKVAGPEVIARIASVLKIPESTVKSWRVADQYSPETILKAYEILIQKDPEKYWPEVLEIEKRIKGKKNKK